METVSQDKEVAARWQLADRVVPHLHEINWEEQLGKQTVQPSLSMLQRGKRKPQNLWL